MTRQNDTASAILYSVSRREMSRARALAEIEGAACVASSVASIRLAIDEAMKRDTIRRADIDIQLKRDLDTISARSYPGEE